MGPNQVDEEIKGIVADVDDFLDALPEPLCQIGQEFTQDGYPYREAFIGNQIAFPGLHLPFWIADSQDRIGNTRQIVLGALFGYLYIRIQDDVYDHNEGNDPTTLLLANEFIRRMYDLYHDLFRAESPFWDWFRKFWQEFSYATAWEIQNCRGSLNSRSGENLPMIGKKLAFAKVPIAAVLLTSGREAEMEKICRIVDMLATSSQLLNDFGSIKRDLATEHFTYPLAHALEKPDVGGQADISDRLFQRLLERESVEKLFQEVLAIDHQILQLLDLDPIEDLSTFITNRIKIVQDMQGRYLRIKCEAILEPVVSGMPQT